MFAHSSLALSSPALFVLQEQTQQTFQPPNYFLPVVLLLLGAGAIGWLVAVVLGFSRARAFGPATKWFALSAVCMLLFHLQFLLFAAAAQTNGDLALGVGAFFPLFIALGAICAIMGFVRLTDGE